MKSGGKNVKKQRSADFQTAEFALGYLYRGIKADIDAFGAAHGATIPVTLVAARLGSLLLSEAGGGILDGAQYLSQVRRHTAEGDEVGIGPEKVHVRPRGDKAPLKPKRVLSKEARKRIGDAQRKRWAKSKKLRKKANSYWGSKTPAERRAEIARRRLVALARKEAKKAA